MPFISLHINLALTKPQESVLAQQLSSLGSKVLGKPEQWVMTLVASGANMSFAGNNQPCAYLECKSIGLNDAQIPELAGEISALLEREHKLDPARIYIEFSSAKAQHCGWNGGTF